MNEDFLHFDLQAEIREAEAQKPWPSGRRSKLLVKKDDLRVILFTMEAGAALEEHHANGSITVQVWSGQIRFRAQGEEKVLQAGQILALSRSIPHSVQAIDDSSFLLTIAWPGA
ncbi:cupin domain-containing protein [Bryobacter aggregatus]|uniref:cupin domain-containing protein n=1 Tax=Bryobacter aggregatus TaxID=360054 RepID=UPI0004E14B59|nr:cupin domain-containing protein [Bryobacter aggregatus]